MKKETLRSVRSQLPKELFFSPAYKAFYYFFRDYTLLIIFSILIYKIDSIVLLLPLWFFHGLTLLALFQLAHDFAHGALLKNKNLSWWLGQICMLPTLHPYHQWVYGHNGIHHGNTSKLKADLAWHPRSPDKFKTMSSIDKTLHRIYWSAFGTGIYYLFKMWLQGLILYPAPNWKAKRDIFYVVFFGILSSTLVIYYGSKNEENFSLVKGLWIFTKLQLIPFLIWNYIISIVVYLQHINKSIIWKTETDWTPFYGQVMATTNYLLPVWINFFAHNIMIHSPHHVHTKIPFYNLPKALKEIQKDYGEYLIIREDFWKDYIDSTNSCKLLDSKNSKWIKYSEI